MNERDRLMIVCVRDHPGISADELADALHVSQRTVYSRIKSSNEILAGVADITFEAGEKGRGYYLRVESAPQLSHLLSSSEHRSAVPDTHLDRVRYLLNDLLSRSDWIKLDDFAETLFVSRTTLSGDLHEVEQVLGHFGLSLEKRPHYGIRVLGSEVSRRLCLASLVLDSAVDINFGAFSGLSPRRDELLKQVDECVSSALGATDYQVSSLVYHNLLVHICIALIRIKSSFYVSSVEDDLYNCKDTREFAVAKRIASEIENVFGIELPEDEVAYISLHLAGKRATSDLSEGAANRESDSMVVPEDTWSLVEEMVELVWNVYHFDFRRDFELHVNLAKHLGPLSVRLSRHFAMDNPLLKDIKNRFPLSYSMAVDASSVLAKRYGVILPENEVGYIALIFALALERRQKAPQKKNILLVCASGRGSAKLLEHQYRKHFGNDINEIATCDVTQIVKIDLSKFDYVITTVPINATLPIPVLEVGFFLSEKETGLVRSALQGTLWDGRDKALPPLLRYFDPHLFLAHFPVHRKEDVLDALCESAARLHTLKSDFRELVYRREELAPTAFGAYTALAHPLSPASDDSFLGVALLDDAIIWNGHEVRAVFLLSISGEHDDGLEGFYSQLADLLMSKESIETLVSDQRLETLMEIARRIDSEERSTR